MRMSAYVFAAVLTAALPHAAAAQSTAASAAPAAVPPAADSKLYGATQSHWVMTGFVGSNFGKSTIDPNMIFGGQVGWLWHGVLGAEGIADFAPSFKIQNNTGLSENPRSNSYMGNAVAALPLGSEGQVQPYVSGGLGYMQLRSTIFNAALPRVAGTPVPTGTTVSDQMKWGSNVGGGVMAFKGLIGFRADVRYYRASKETTFESTTPAGQFGEALLSGLDYWRTNVGVALRW